MSSIYKYKFFASCLGVIFFFLIFSGIVHPSDQKEGDSQKIEGLQVILEKVKKAVKTKNYEVLKPYISKKEPLAWGICGPTDVEPEKMSFKTMTRRLLEISKGTEIYVCEKPDVDPWNIKKTVFMVDIKTEGWIGEYPFLNFGFEYSKADNRWEFIGICDSARAPLQISKEGKYEEVYCRKPKLPRPGPRIFEDNLALRVRIEEIVRFKEFEALKPYAVRKTLVFGECGLNMKGERIIKGKEKSVDDVVNFLNKNTSSANQIKSTGLKNKWNYDTEGWSGKYPYISFWFDEGKYGWELTGVAYCKTSLMKLSYPNDPRIK